MRIVVDTNLVFSAILNTDSTIGDLLLNSGELFKFYSCNYLRNEIETHRYKLMELAQKTHKELVEIEYLVCSEILFVNEEQIPEKYFKQAVKLVKDVDYKDVAFVALNDYMDSILWTGDKKLIKGLKENGYLSVISTAEMVQLRNRLEKE